MTAGNNPAIPRITPSRGAHADCKYSPNLTFVHTLVPLYLRCSFLESHAYQWQLASAFKPVPQTAFELLKCEEGGMALVRVGCSTSVCGVAASSVPA